MKIILWKIIEFRLKSIEYQLHMYVNAEYPTTKTTQLNLINTEN